MILAVSEVGLILTGLHNRGNVSTSTNSRSREALRSDLLHPSSPLHLLPPPVDVRVLTEDEMLVEKCPDLMAWT